MTPWSVLFVLLFLGILGGVAGFTEWFVRATYYVGTDGGYVAIYQGRPGGLLWYKPTLVEVTRTKPAQVFPPYQPLLKQGIIETSYDAAKRVAANLTNGSVFLALPTAPSTTSTSTTTTTTTTFYSASTVAAPPTTSTGATTTTVAAGQ